MGKLTTRWATVAALALPLFSASFSTAHAGDAGDRGEIAVLFVKNYPSGNYAKTSACFAAGLASLLRWF